jgi:hypothetical protein
MSSGLVLIVGNFREFVLHCLIVFLNLDPLMDSLARSLFTPRQFGTQALVGLGLRVVPLTTILSLVKILGATPALEAFMSTLVIASALMMFHVLVGYPMLVARASKPQFNLEESTNDQLGLCLLMAATLGGLIYLLSARLNVLLTAGAPTLQMQESLHWLSLWLVISIGGAPLRGALTLKGYFNQSLAFQVSTFIVLGFAVWGNPSYIGQHVTQTYVIFVLVETILTYFIVRYFLGIRPMPNFRTAALKKTGMASRWLVPAFMLQSALYAADVPTAALAGEGAVLVFQSVFRVPFFIMLSVSGAIAGLVGVAVTQRNNKAVSYAELVATLRVALKIAGGAVCLSILVTSGLIFGGLAGEVSSKLWWVVGISALMIPISTMSSVINKFFDILDIQHYLPRIYVAVLVTRVAVAYPLVMSFGFVGVALTLLAGQLSLFFGYIYFLNHSKIFGSAPPQSVGHLMAPD